MSKKPKGSITFTVANPLDLSIPRNTVDLIITKIPDLYSSPIMGIDSANTINTQDKKKYLRDLKKLFRGLYSILRPGGSIIFTSSKFQDLSKQLVLDLIDEGQLTYQGDIFEFNEFVTEDDQMVEQIQYDRIRSWHHFSKGMPFINPYKLRHNNLPVWFVNPEHPGIKTVEWVAETYPDILAEPSPDIVEKFIEIFSKDTSMIFDPFGGTGAVAITASSLGRNAISNDPNSDIIKPAKLRLIIALGEKFAKENVKVVPL